MPPGPSAWRCSFKEAVEACHAPVHYEDAPGPASALAPWRLWLEAQCSYHDGDYSSAGRLLQQLQEARRREAATVTAAAAFGERPVQPVRAKRDDGMLAAVVALPTEEEVSCPLATWQLLWAAPLAFLGVCKDVSWQLGRRWPCLYSVQGLPLPLCPASCCSWRRCWQTWRRRSACGRRATR